MLLLVCDVAAFAGLAQAVAFDRAGENYGGRALVLYGSAVGGVDLVGVVATEAQSPQLIVTEVGHHALQARVDTPEVLAYVCATGHRVLLVLAVDNRAHAIGQEAVVVLGEQGVPVAAPDDLDDVPADAAEDGLQLLNDLAVAAHRAVQPLQVAVHDEDEVVLPLPRREGDGAQ